MIARWLILSALGLSCAGCATQSTTTKPPSICVAFDSLTESQNPSPLTLDDVQVYTTSGAPLAVRSDSGGRGLALQPGGVFVRLPGRSFSYADVAYISRGTRGKIGLHAADGRLLTSISLPTQPQGRPLDIAAADQNQRRSSVLSAFGDSGTISSICFRDVGEAMAGDADVKPLQASQ